jgi:molecular chaperone GrpE
MQNVQRRGVQNERVARQQGVSAVVASIVPVVDHFDMALGQDPSKATAESIISGVRVIRDELLRALASQGVAAIVPQAGDEFVPGRHEALSQQPGNGVRAGSILMTYQAGFILTEGDTQRVLRPAKVVIAT